MTNRKRWTILGLISLGLLVISCFLYRVPPHGKEPGIPRYDIQRELKKLDRRPLTGYFVRGGLKVSNLGRISGRNIFLAHEIVERFRESTTTEPEYVAQGENMKGVDFKVTGQCIGVTYIDGLAEKSITIPTIPGQEEVLFGPSCGKMVKDLWEQVSDPAI